MTSLPLDRIARALDGVPRAAYSVPHVYPSAAPAFVPAPMAERPPLRAAKLRLYAHVPYCRYHCTFCYFAVRVGASADAMARYVRALAAELEWVAPGTPLTQLFVGGGTPTALPPELLDEMLERIFARARPDGSGVHTVETSPETISPAHIDVLKRRGIGRVSMGIQSLDAEVLGSVHRRQTREQALAACELLVSSGLVVNVDLIYGLPQQTEAGFLDDLRAVAACGVPAVTLYSLRVTERTGVAKQLEHDEPFDLASLLRWRAFVKRSAEVLGYTQTRWHTFKRLDTIASTHERLPCFDDDMAGYQLGIGMSARSHLGFTVYRNHEQLEPYLARVEAGQSPVEHVFDLDEEDRMTQLIARTLGDGRALVRDDYARTFGRPIERDFGSLLDRLQGAGLLETTGPALALTPTGELLYDVVTLAFYPRRARDWLMAREPRAAFVRIDTEPASV